MAKRCIFGRFDEFLFEELLHHSLVAINVITYSVYIGV